MSVTAHNVNKQASKCLLTHCEVFWSHALQSGILPDRECLAALPTATEPAMLLAGGVLYKELRVGLSGVMYCCSAGATSSSSSATTSTPVSVGL